MRHFIAYHNTDKMGRAFNTDGPLRLLTNKPINHLLQETVWFVVGDGAGVRQYSLGSVFRMAETGDAAEDGFKRLASGPGHVFEPPVLIKELPWFPEVLRATGHFGLGVQEVKDEAVIAGLKQLAVQAGYPDAEPGAAADTGGGVVSGTDTSIMPLLPLSLVVRRKES